MNTSREIIHMATRRVREGSGSYRPSTANAAWLQSIPDLKTLFSHIPFVIIGGLATRLYMPERMTFDVDVLIRSDDAQAAANYLRAFGATRSGELSIGGETWTLPGGRQIDLIYSDAQWISEALSQPCMGPDGQPYIQLPWLVLLKLSASRTQDLADCSRMLGEASEDVLEQVLDAVRVHQPADLEDVLRLIKLGKLEKKDSQE